MEPLEICDPDDLPGIHGGVEGGAWPDVAFGPDGGAEVVEDGRPGQSSLPGWVAAWGSSTGGLLLRRGVRSVLLSVLDRQSSGCCFSLTHAIVLVLSLGVAVLAYVLYHLVFPPVSDPAPFTVMSWNVLADGLHDDGFVVPLRDEGSLKKVSDSVWDKVVQVVRDENVPVLSEAWVSDGSTTVAERDADATMAEFVADQETFKRLVLDPVIDYASQCKGGQVLKKNKCPTRILSAFGQVYRKVTGEITATNVEDAKIKLLEDCPCRDTIKQVFGCRDKVSSANALLHTKWDFERFHSESQKILAWEPPDGGAGGEKGRGQRLVDRICTPSQGSIRACPDIVAIQEVDHYRFFQEALGELGYRTTLVEGDEQLLHDQAIDCSSKKDRNTDDDADCIGKRMEDMTFARITKFGSKARSKSRGIDKESDPDNDGQALFWKRDRFEAVYITKKYFSKTQTSSGGVVGVLLKGMDQSSVSGVTVCVFAVTTHLSSGSSSSNEQERIDQATIIATWLEAELANGVKVAMETAKCRGPGVVLLMDGNSYQDFAAAEITKEDNMYNSVVRGKMGLTNFELDQGNIQQPEREISKEKHTADEREDLPKNIAYSVNKIRGIGSAQLAKVGQYQLDRIDYACVSGHFIAPSVKVTKLSAQPSEGGLPIADRAADRNGKRSPYGRMLPNYDNPSDHLPIVAELTFKRMNEWPE